MEKEIPKNFILQWSITEKCNLNCKHCYRNEKMLKQELNLQEQKEILDKFIGQLEKWNLPKEKVRLHFSGGEPLFSEKLLPLLEKCVKNHDKFSYGILTNGTLINEQKIKKLKDLEIDYAQVSLEGLEKKNDQIRGKGVFKKAVRSVKLLKQAGITTNLSFTVSKMNLDEVPKMVKLAKEIGVLISFGRLVPIGNASKLNDLMLSPKEIKKLWIFLLKERQVNWPKITLTCEDGMLAQEFSDYNVHGCPIGYYGVSLMPNGEVYPCRRLPVTLGNIKEVSFGEIYNTEIMRQFRNVDDNINKTCYNCSHFQRCKGGAKCLVYSYFNDFNAPDPQCWGLFEELPDKIEKWTD